jgi:hypothetical protein
MRAASRRAVEGHNQNAWLAWHAAYLPKFKRPTPLRELMARVDPAKTFTRRQKPEDRLALMRQLQGAVKMAR